MSDPLSSVEPARLGKALTIRVSSSGNVTTVRVTGEIDGTTTARLAEELTTAIELRPSALVADLGEVTFCSSQGLGALLSANESAKTAGVPYTIVTDQHALLRPIQVLGLDRVLRIHADRAEAESWLAQVTRPQA